MNVNSRRYLKHFASAATAHQLILVSSNAGDFALIKPAGDTAGIAILSMIRPSHRSLRVDGFVGPISTGEMGDPKTAKTTLTQPSVSHLLNIDELRLLTFLDDSKVSEGIHQFVATLDEILLRLAKGGSVHGLMRSSRTDITIGPMPSRYLDPN